MATEGENPHSLRESFSFHSLVLVRVGLTPNSSFENQWRGRGTSGWSRAKWSKLILCGVLVPDSWFLVIGQSRWHSSHLWGPISFPQVTPLHCFLEDSCHLGMTHDDEIKLSPGEIARWVSYKKHPNDFFFT